MELNEEVIGLLDYLFYHPEVYGINLPRHLAEPLEKMKLIEWVPPKFNTTMYNLTENARKEVPWKRKSSAV